MENPSRILVFGDSIAKGIAPYLEQELMSLFADEERQITIINGGISGETSEQGRERLQRALTCKPNIVVINYGMNDWRKGVSIEQFAKNLRHIVSKCKEQKCRVILNTINPDHNGSTYRFSQENRNGESPEIELYNEVIRQTSQVQRIRIADIYNYWNRYFPKTYLALEDAIHPNWDGYQVSVKAILPVLTRTQNLILWQFNGRYAHCNYSCPYCYVPTSVNKGMHFNFDLDKWEKAFNKHFGEQKTVFYFSYGEPMLAKHFYEVLEMVGKNKNWEVKVTSNLSLPLDKLLNSTVAKEGRLNVNASFHPTETTIDEFLLKLEELRSAGIEPSVVYVMYPPQIDDFEKKYQPLLRENGYVVHIRAFRGLHKWRKYPGAYTEEQFCKTAKYMDRANLKYQLGEVSGLGRNSCIGMNHLLVDNFGDIEMCDSYVGDRSYGNLFDDELNLALEPKPFPGLVPLAAVDDIADYTELGYKDLVGNNVLAYAKQGGVYKKEDGTVVYPFEDVDFTDLKVRQELMKVDNPFQPEHSFWLNIRWFFYHFVYSFVFKKYGKFIWAFFKGKWRLLKKGKLKLDRNFWHS